jgi:MFS family permease
MAELATPAAVGAEIAVRQPARRYFVLGLLTLIYALNFLDRTIFNVLIEPIKKEFALSDTAMGLLAGFGFVLFHSLMGIPIARVADRLNRRNIVALALAFWSTMTFFCGMAQSVTTLALARIGVGIGESAGTPASQSMVSDLFDKNERPRALGVYAIGTYLGVFLGYFIGGFVNQHSGWRMAFFCAGLPGIVLAVVLWLTVSEPRRGAMAETFTPEPFGPTLGMAGTLVGGLVVAQISQRDDRWKLWAPAITSCLAGPVFAVCMLTSSFSIMVAALALTSFLVGFHLGPIFAIAQTVARPSMRALATAIILLISTCFGQGVGPLAVGIINDALKDTYGTDAVRYSLLSAALTTSLGALLLVWAARSIRGDIRRAM